MRTGIRGSAGHDAPHHRMRATESPQTPRGAMPIGIAPRGGAVAGEADARRRTRQTSKNTVSSGPCMRMSKR